MELMVMGIDVGKEKLDVCLRLADRRVFGQFENTAAGYQLLMRWLVKQGVQRLHVCMEATGQYGDDVAEYFYKKGQIVSVVNPARIKHYGRSQLRRNKTDKADAELIADFGANQKPAPWSPLSPEIKALQALVRRLEDLMSARLQEANRLQSGVSIPAVTEDIQAHLEFLDQKICKLKAAIRELMDQYPHLHHQQTLLETIPGIGWLTAAKILAEIRNIQDFESARQLAAYAGLTPENTFSGSSVHKKPRLSKKGNANLRKALFMPAISAKHHNPIVAEFCGRLLASGHCPMEVVGAAMRKLLHIVYGVLKHDQPFDPHYLDSPMILS